MPPSHACRRQIIEYLAPDLSLFRSRYALLFGGRLAQPQIVKHAMALFAEGCFERLIVSGGRTRGIAVPEAVEIGEKLVASGFPSSRLILECESTNTVENVILCRAAVGHDMPELLLIGRMHAKRRYLMTVRKQWPEVERLTCASLNYFGVPPEQWWRDPFLKGLVFAEVRNIPAYLSRGHVSEISVAGGRVVT